MELLPHQQRVVEEQKELQTKIDKLGLFINSEKFNELSGTDQMYLNWQLDPMMKYAAILQLRIENFKK